VGSEADHSSLSGAEVKNVCNYTFNSPVRLHDVVIKQRGKFNFYTCKHTHIRK
jgi:hypothetical protein